MVDKTDAPSAQAGLLTQAAAAEKVKLAEAVEAAAVTIQKKQQDMSRDCINPTIKVRHSAPCVSGCIRLTHLLVLRVDVAG